MYVCVQCTLRSPLSFSSLSLPLCFPSIHPSIHRSTKKAKTCTSIIQVYPPFNLPCMYLYLHNAERERERNISTIDTKSKSMSSADLQALFIGTCTDNVTRKTKERKKGASGWKSPSISFSEQLRICHLPWLLTMTSFFACADSSASTHTMQSVTVSFERVR